MTDGMRVLHVTDASSSGVLTAVTTIARQQSEDSEVLPGGLRVRAAARLARRGGHPAR